MALDKSFTQEISIGVSGDQLLKVFDAFALKIDSVTRELAKMNTDMLRGGETAERKYRAVAQQLQRVTGEANTVFNLMKGMANKPRDSFLSILDEQSLGKKAISASKLRQELSETTKASDALELRLFGLQKRLANLAQQGRSGSKTDLTRVLQTTEALTQVRALERELSKLDARAKIRGGYSADEQQIRSQLNSQMGLILAQAKNAKFAPANGYGTAIEGAAELTRRLKGLAVEQENVARKANQMYQALRQNTLKNVNLGEAELRAQLQKQASRFAFTGEQARGFDMRATAAQIDGNIAKLQRLQDIQSRVLNSPTLNTERNLRRLSKAWEDIQTQTSEALARKRAYDALPENRMAALTSAVFSNLGATGLRVGGFMAIAQAAGAVFGAVQDGARAVVEFDDGIAKLQAISGATDTQMRQLADGILEVGKTTRFSVADITEATTQIAQAGYAADEALSVLKSSLSLATASGSSPAEAVDTVTSALGAFQLQASEATQVVDTLVAGLNDSKLSITQMQAALQYVGATARESGLTLQDLVASAASLSNAGIRSGSTIGTGLRQLIVDLQTPTDKFRAELEALGLTMADVDVKALGLDGVVKKLTDAGFTAEAAYRSFENRAASAFLAFRGQIDNYDKLALAIAQSGAAQEAEAKAMESLSAQWQNLKNKMVAFLTSAAEPVMSALVTVTKLLGSTFDALGQLTRALGLSSSEMAKFATEAGLLVAALVTGNPILGAVSIFIALNDVLSQGAQKTEQLATKTAETQAEFEKSKQTISSVDEAMRRLVDRQDILSTNHTALMTEVVTLTGRFSGLSGELSGVALNYDNLVKAMLRYKGEVMRQAALNAEASKTASTNQRADYASQLSANVASFDRPREAIVRGTSTLRQPVKNAINYVAANRSRNYEQMSTEDLLVSTNNTQMYINQISRLGNLTNNEQTILDLLNERLRLLRQISTKTSEITQAQSQIDIFNAKRSKGSQGIDAEITSISQGITRGLQNNERSPGSGDGTLSSVVNQARTRIASLKSMLDSLPAASGQAVVLADQIQQLEAAVARVTSVNARAGNDKPAGGSTQSGDVVAQMIRGQYRGANVYSTGARPMAEQQRLYEAMLNGTGAKAAKPGNSMHGSGRALDMTPIPGVSLDQIVAFLESRQVHVTEALAEKNPKTGRTHWHIGWAPKKSKLQSQEDRDQEKALKELQQLAEQEAGYRETGASKSIQELITKAKTGAANLDTLGADFANRTQEYRSAALAKFDVANPTAGASPAKLKMIQGARRELENKLNEDIDQYSAQLWGAVSDVAQKVLDAAMKSASDSFDRASFTAGADSRYVAQQQATLGNQINRFRYGAGATAMLNRQAERAKNTQLRGDIGGYDAQLESLKSARFDYQWQTASTTGEQRLQAEAKLLEINRQIEDITRKRAEAQAELNARTQEGVDAVGSLTDRLKESANSWLESSGAADSWGKRLEDNVGPALNNLTEGFTGLFDSVFNGSKSFGAALGDMVSSFASFVQQIIIQALALEAVKAILGAFGLSLPGMYDGGQVKGGSSGKAVNKIEGRYNGGPIGYLATGGEVTRGVRTRDSALYNLAKGEYVVRNKSVSELGLPFMDSINKHGKRGLEKMVGAGSMLQMVQAPKQETNVYVVQEKQLPPMTPSDVLVTLQNDILSNGTTKKLIKQVAQGG